MRRSSLIRERRCTSGGWVEELLETRSRIVRPLSAADPITFLIAVALAAAISTGVFAHASKHGSRHATAWGVATFLFAGVTVPVYFIRYWARRGARK
jgi:hypothetical protein